MRRELYSCDRKGCKNTCESDADAPFSYNEVGWVGLVVRSPEPKILDFCSWECLSMWADEKVKEIRR